MGLGLHIESDEADRLARELAAVTGESLATAVTVALAERLSRVARPYDPSRRQALREIRERVSHLPVRDDRPAEDVLGPDDAGRFA